MHPAVGASKTGRVNAAATGVAQQFVRVGIHPLHADALHLNVCRLAVQMLSAMGKSPLPIESTTVEQLVTAGITTIAALVAWWKNNSFTKEAIAADKEYDRLKAKSGK